MKHCTVLMLLLVMVCQAKAQAPVQKEKGSFYFGFGFHRVYYTNSDIRFCDTKTADYDFTIYNVRAVDDNSFDFGEGIDAPQYSYRVGYYFKGKKDLGIEFSFDHAKYIVVQYQQARVAGHVNGESIDGDTLLHRGFIEYEHTDGANYYMLNLSKKKQLIRSPGKKHSLALVIKPGAGIVLPRSDTRVMGLHRDDRYHIAGYVIGLDAGLRYEFFKHFFIEASARGAFANYSDVLLYGDGRASQKWWSLQTIGIAGFRFRL